MREISNSEFIYLNRKIMNWEWYSDTNTMMMFLHCLLRANWKDSEWKGIKVKRGQFVTSLASLSAETGLSEKCCRTALSHLIKSETIKSTPINGQGIGRVRGRIITIVKYDEYQSKGKQTDRLRAGCGQAAGNSRINKNENNTKNEEEEILPPGAVRLPDGSVDYENVPSNWDW